MEKRRGIPNTTVESSREKEENEAICDQGVWRIRVSETTMKGLREIRIRLSLSSYEEVFCVLLASYKEATGSRTSQSSDTLHEGGYPRNKESGLDNDGIKTMADEEVTLEIKEEPCETYSIVKEEDTLNPLQEEMSGDHRTESERTLQKSGKPIGTPETSLEHHNLEGRWTGGSEALSMHGQRDVGPNDSMMDGRLEDGWTEDDDDGGKEMDVPQSSEGTLTCFIKEEPEDSDSTEDEGSNLHDIPSCSQQGWNPGLQSSYQRMENTQEMSGDTSHDRSHGKHLPEDFPLQGVQGSQYDVSARTSCSSEYDSYLIPNQVDYSQGQSADETATMSDHNDGRLHGDITVGCGVKYEISGDASCDRSPDQGQSSAERATVGYGERSETNSLLDSLLSSQPLLTGSNQNNPNSNRAIAKPFICPVCNKGFSRKDSLWRHQNLHSEERPYGCSFCKQRFFYEYRLTAHLRSHTGEKPYACLYCEKTFSRSNHVKRHMRIHTGERPYRCTVCAKAFTDKTYLTDHMSVHTGEKPHECTQCGQRFSRSNVLTTHLRTHLERKLYECTLCDRAFLHHSSLTKHMKTHTENTL